ncbi:hypothetical protein A3K73_07510 [Candidatus Pacearchaeota archaeon RBG_13_36_9]|nr:MAG: hypothetical protein A3K73_07510 [Candidatus Pacearchaeota archaeon RBG_13_36_9]
MKILLIRPPQIRWKYEAKRIGAPIGLLSLASVLRDRNIEVGLVDSAVEGFNQEREIKEGLFEYGLSDSEVEEKVSSFNPDFVGIASTHTSYWEQQKRLAKLIKRINSHTLVLIGGHHASGIAGYIARNVPEIDHIFVGESETSLLRFIASRGGRVISGQREDLASLPNPAFDLLDSAHYTYKMSHYGIPRSKNFITNVISRGCPSACDYCTSSQIFGKKVRLYPLERVAEQINLIQARGFEEYVSQDDNVVTWPRAYRSRFFGLLRESNMPWVLDGGLYYSMASPELIEKLAENGCYRVFLPVENPNLDLMHAHNKYRNLRTSQAQNKKLEEVIENLNRACIEFYLAIMIGFPGETWESIKDAVEFGRKLKSMGAIGLGFHWVHPYPFSPFYDSSYRLVEASRRWETAPEYSTFIKPVFPINGVSLEEAEQYVNEQFENINRTRTLNNSYHYRQSFV